MKVPLSSSINNINISKSKDFVSNRVSLATNQDTTVIFQRSLSVERNRLYLLRNNANNAASDTFSHMNSLIFAHSLAYSLIVFGLNCLSVRNHFDFDFQWLWENQASLILPTCMSSDSKTARQVFSATALTLHQIHFCCCG